MCDGLSRGNSPADQWAMFPHGLLPPTPKKPEPMLELRFDTPDPLERDDLPPAATVPHAPCGDVEFMAHR